MCFKVDLKILNSYLLFVFTSLPTGVLTNNATYQIMLPTLYFNTVSGGQSTQIKYLSKSTDTYNKILLQ